LVEAGVRSGAVEEAAAALQKLEGRTRASGTDWGLGVLARSKALLSDDHAAESLYREAIERLERRGIVIHLARAHLLYGEWLRRVSRRHDGREHLRIAYQTFRGSEAESAPLIEAAIADARAAGPGVTVQMLQWVSAVLWNGLGRYEEALAEARSAEQVPEMQISMWALPELIEAASRTRQTQLAADAFCRLAEATSIGQTDWAQGIYARSRALLSD